MKTEARYEMTPDNLEEALAMARASTPGCRYGEALVEDEEWKAILARGEQVPVWCTWVPDGETSLFASVTGNGPTSKANAFFFAHARDIVIALGEEVAALRVQVASARAEERARIVAWLRREMSEWPADDRLPSLAADLESGAVTVPSESGGSHG